MRRLLIYPLENSRCIVTGAVTSCAMGLIVDDHVHAVVVLAKLAKLNYEGRSLTSG